MDAIARGLATRALAEIALLDVGQPVELRTTSTHLQWRRVGQPNWTDLVPLVETGSALDFNWNGTQLGVKREKESTYSYVDLIGPVGPQGETGPTGPGLEFTWNDTKLGVRVAGETEYAYTDLEGPTGQTGPAGEITSVSAESVPPEENPSIDLGGTATHRTMHFKIPQGERGEKGEADLTGFDTDVLPHEPLLFAVDERSIELVRDGNGNLITVLEKSGGTVVKETTLARTNGDLTSVTEEADGRTVVSTLHRTAGVLTGVTRSAS